MEKQIFLVDGFNLAYRSFYAMPDLKRSDSFPTQALHGWIRTVWKFLEGKIADEVWVFFDLGGSQARLALMPEYKANRPPMPEDLVQQIPLLKDLCQLMGHGIIEESGIEADDLLATVALKFSNEGHHVHMISSDKDFSQLLHHANIHQWVPPPTMNIKLGWQCWDAQAVEAKFGVTPMQIVDYLSLIGDTADNIPGIEGVGPKTAAKWLKNYQSLEGILKNIDHLTPERFRKLLTEKQTGLHLNQQLIQLKTDLKIELPALPKQKYEKIVEFFKTYEMKTTLTWFEKKYGNTSDRSSISLNQTEWSF